MRKQQLFKIMSLFGTFAIFSILLGHFSPTGNSQSEPLSTARVTYPVLDLASDDITDVESDVGHEIVSGTPASANL